MISKSDFEWVWKDSSVYDILDQFYWEHIELQKQNQKINKAVELINNTHINCEGIAEDLLVDILNILQNGSDKKCLKY